MKILRRIKDKFKKLMRKKNTVRHNAQSFCAKEAPKNIPGLRETVIEQAKFSNPQHLRQGGRFMPQELPSEYGQDQMALLVRDYRWLYTYWEVKGSTWENLKKSLGGEFHRAKRVLRAYDVTAIDFNGNNANRFFDIEINESANNWYIDTNGPGRSWCVDLGLLLVSGRFVTILRSNTAHTPFEGPSWITDEEWMIPEDMFARLYGMGFGLGRSSAAGKNWQIFSQVISSGGVASMASPIKKVSQEKDFWLKVDCELIVYGATDPGALVTVQDKPVNLRKDGTFTLRFSLPEGKQVVPIKARSADNQDERNITPIITRETK
ncbi:MAG: DUF4912 domain-containing protein [Candidatus Omnitrophota bacterium]